ncbi:MAG: class I SAM-dependent methyltransferase [Nitrospirae bacterium]|nr:class I SAM-dependent methyltransferase [Nitrospirota bacterium]
MLIKLKKLFESSFKLDLDYPFVSKPRYTINAPHKQLYEIIARNNDRYSDILNAMQMHEIKFRSISINQGLNRVDPYWDNGWFPVLDAMVLYHFLVINNPSTFIEVGSGNSTKFARRAITDHGLRTKIISIDPYPRADIDSICDQVIRERLEDVDLSIFSSLGAQDIVFIDNSHRIFMNSDATVVFLDILPILESGVLIQLHDICLPYDYPEDWVARYYSEQYGLACYLLAQGGGLETVFPCKFIVHDNKLSPVVEDLCNRSGLATVQRNGCSFWLRRK